MTAIEMLGQVVAGLRIALILFAVMSLLTGTRMEGATLTDKFRARGATMLALAIVAYSPAHTAWLLGSPFPRIASRSLDLIGSALSCGCMIYLLAGRALRRGLSEQRVRRGMHMNILVLAAIVGTKCLIR